MHALEALGCDMAVSLCFDAAMAAMPAQAFVSDILAGWLGVTHVVAGYDFVFGHDRQGSLEFLRSSAEVGGFEVTGVGPIRDSDGTVFSSTAIRERLMEGDVRAAAALLGRPWEIEGPVLHGDELGRTIGFPTANVGLGEYLRPAAGIYVTLNGLERPDGSVEWIEGVASIGSRPTVGGTDFRLETYLFDFDREIYGRTIRVRLLEWLRPEAKFTGLTELTDQIRSDVTAARAYFAGSR
jgi:riboflavin kinase/FMN adenylyltransferase